MLLVKASRILLTPSLSLSELDQAQEYMKSFLVGFEAVYPNKFLVTANFHNALHLKETILDYSASPSHWLFDFERYNQDIKGFRTNGNGCVEKTYLNKFLLQVHAQDYSVALLSNIPDVNKTKVKELFSSQKVVCHPTLSEEYNQACGSFCAADFNNAALGVTFASGSECLPPKSLISITPSISNLPENIVTCLVGYYNSVYSSNYINSFPASASPLSIPVNWQVTKFKHVE
ncbi:hypothetical protein EDC96DRAFT_582185 [Choanephora cucurbitarum]|nr:hypothetical protein EDC96DRAFT_582185 [Choanephora cucurbitarum]